MTQTHNIDWSTYTAPIPSALDLFAEIANQRKYTLTLSPKKYSDKPVEYHCIALPHGANQKAIRGEGASPEDAIIDLWEKLQCSS